MENGRNCPFCRVFACLQGPQAAAVAINAVNIVHLPPGVLLGTFGGMDDDLGLRGNDGIGGNHANKAIFASCWLCK